MTNPQSGTRLLGKLETPVAYAHDDISPGAGARARAAYAALPDIRHWKVLDIQRRLAAGTFRPSAADVADAILDSAAKSLLCR